MIGVFSVKNALLKLHNSHNKRIMPQKRAGKMVTHLPGSVPLSLYSLVSNLAETEDHKHGDAQQGD